jgi:hypothetical protein
MIILTTKDCVTAIVKVDDSKVFELLETMR